MRMAKNLLLVVLLLTMVASARKRDPLTEAEADQLREVALEPQKRLKLYIKFAESRLVAIDQLRSDPKFADGRGKKINDNLDTYEGRPLDKSDRKDFKKGLKDVIEASDKFDLKLRTLKSATETDPQAKKESLDYGFALADAQEALKSSGDMAREYLSEKDKDATAEKK